MKSSIPGSKESSDPESRPGHFEILFREDGEIIILQGGKNLSHLPQEKLNTLLLAILLKEIMIQNRPIFLIGGGTPEDPDSGGKLNG